MKAEPPTHFIVDIIANEILFDTKEEIHVRDVIRSLQALQRISKRTPSVLNTLFESKINDAELFIERLESGSLLEKIALRLFFKDEAGLNAFLDQCREKWVVNEDGKVKTLAIAGFATVFLGLTGYGLFHAGKASTANVQQVIEFNNNTIFMSGADAFGVETELFTLAIQNGAKRNIRQLARDSIDMVAPAKNSGGNIIVNNAILEQATIHASPSALSQQPDEIIESFPDADIQIRATDMDSQSRGWAAVFPGVVDRRVPMEIHADLDADLVISSMRNRTLRADIEVVYQRRSRSRASELTPTKIVVTGIITE